MPEHGANVVAEPAQPTFGGNILVPEGEGSSVAVEGSILASAGTVIIGEDGTRMMSENSALLSDTNTAAEAAAGGTAGTVFTTPDGNTFKVGEGDILTDAVGNFLMDEDGNILTTAHLGALGATTSTGVSLTSTAPTMATSDMNMIPDGAGFLRTAEGNLLTDEEGNFIAADGNIIKAEEAHKILASQEAGLVNTGEVSDSTEATPSEISDVQMDSKSDAAPPSEPMLTEKAPAAADIDMDEPPQVKTPTGSPVEVKDPQTNAVLEPEKPKSEVVQELLETPASIPSVDIAAPEAALPGTKQENEPQNMPILETEDPEAAASIQAQASTDAAPAVIAEEAGAVLATGADTAAVSMQEAENILQSAVTLADVASAAAVSTVSEIFSTTDTPQFTTAGAGDIVAEAGEAVAQVAVSIPSSSFVTTSLPVELSLPSSADGGIYTTADGRVLSLPEGIVTNTAGHLINPADGGSILTTKDGTQQAAGGGAVGVASTTSGIIMASSGSDQVVASNVEVKKVVVNIGRLSVNDPRRKRIMEMETRIKEHSVDDIDSDNDYEDKKLIIDEEQEQDEVQENVSKIKTVEACDAAFEFNHDDSNSDIDVSDEESVSMIDGSVLGLMDEGECAVCHNSGDNETLHCCERCNNLFHSSCSISPNGEQRICILCSTQTDIFSLSNKITSGKLSQRDLQLCRRLLYELKNIETSFEPYRDYVADKIKIRETITLDVIKEALEDKDNPQQYSSVRSFLEDLRKMFRNCLTINHKESLVFKHYETMKEKLKSILNLWTPKFADMLEKDEDNNAQKRPTDESDSISKKKLMINKDYHYLKIMVTPSPPLSAAPEVTPLPPTSPYNYQWSPRLLETEDLQNMEADAVGPPAELAAGADTPVVMQEAENILRSTVATRVPEMQDAENILRSTVTSAVPEILPTTTRKFIEETVMKAAKTITNTLIEHLSTSMNPTFAAPSMATSDINMIPEGDEAATLSVERPELPVFTEVEDGLVQVGRLQICCNASDKLIKFSRSPFWAGLK